MKKLLFIFIILIGMTLTLSACNKEKAVIFYSSKPITRETFSVDKAEVYFKVGQRIYFLLYNPKPFTSNVLRLQVLKLDQKYPATVPSIAYGRDISIDTSKPFVTDYFVLNSAGYYFLRIYSSDEYFTPIAEADFKVD